MLEAGWPRRVLQGHHRAVERLELLAIERGHPVLVPEHLKDGAADEGDGVRLELHIAAGVEAVDALDEPDDACPYEILAVQPAGEARDQPPGGDLDEVGIMIDEVCPSFRVLVDLEVHPGPLQLFWRQGHTNVILQTFSSTCERLARHRKVRQKPGQGGSATPHHV
jgi:hypothetical protein